MATTNLINIHTFSAIMMPCILLALLPVVNMSLSIDEQILAGSTSANTFDMFQIKPDIRVGIKLDLDMMLTVDQYKTMLSKENKTIGKASVVRQYNYIWRKRTVYYEITARAKRYKSVIEKAMEHISVYTCVKFFEFGYGEPRVQFIEGDGCWSQVGMVGGVQYVSLNVKCSEFASVLHQLQHVLGFYHEHNRPDRAQSIYFFTVNMAYVNISMYQIDTYANTYGFPYDYRSITHFKGDSTIRTINPNYRDIIGHATSLSWYDIKVTNWLYDCGNLCNVDCPFNGFVVREYVLGEPPCVCWCYSGDPLQPLKLCSQLTHEIPQYNFPTSSKSDISIPEHDKSTCIDVRKDCEQLKHNGKCASKRKSMYNQCTKTCNFCGKGNNLCMDYEDGCHMMAGSGACKDAILKQTMSKMCRKSCGLCQNPASPCEIQDTLD